VSRGARVAAPLALAALTAVAALSLGRVVDSSRFVLPVLGAALLPHAIAAAVRARRRPPWLTLVLSVLALVAYVVLVLEPAVASTGLPGTHTWSTLHHQLSGGWTLLRNAPAPAPTTDGAILLAVLMVWCMATLADWLAFVRRTALAALGPALVFFVWTSTLGTDDLRLVLTAAFCAAAAAFVLAQHLALLDQRRSWLVSHHGARPRWLVPAAALATGAIAFALVVAPLVPGAGSDPVLDVAGPGRDGSGGRSYKPEFPPFVDIGQKLDSARNEELFTVRSPVGDYWRIAALDTYSGRDGGQWTLSADGDGSVGVGLPDEAPRDSVQQEFSIGPLSERWLPAAYRPVAINLPDTLVVKSSGTIVSDASSVSHLRYTVASQLPPLDASTITATQIAATEAPTPASLAPEVALPHTAEIARIQQRAEQIVTAAGATTPYAEAVALRDYFRNPANGFVYDTTVGTTDDGSAILQFLELKRGFCVQFASAYAVMARSLGIPARVAVGFTAGTPGADGRYHVTSHDAHAWPEIHLAGLGWTHLFDPTPGRDTASTGGSDSPNDTATPTPPPTAATVAPPPATAGTPEPGPSSGDGATSPTTAPPTLAPSPAHRSGSSGAWLPALLAIVAFVLVVGGYAGAVLAAKRRRRTRRRAAERPVDAVRGAWAEVLDRLHEASITPRPEHTALDLADVLGDGPAAPSAGPLRDLAGSYSAARYGGEIADADARAAWTSVEEIERALDDGTSWLQRWRRRLDPTTLVRR
jgi:transglutaminase-like putative cysteine protease